jgi:hypothetical protein
VVPYTQSVSCGADAAAAVVLCAGGPEEAVPAEVAWKQGHVVEVVRYKQIWLDQADAEVRPAAAAAAAAAGVIALVRAMR